MVLFGALLYGLRGFYQLSKRKKEREREKESSVSLFWCSASFFGFLLFWCLLPLPHSLCSSLFFDDVIDRHERNNISNETSFLLLSSVHHVVVGSDCNVNGHFYCSILSLLLLPGLQPEPLVFRCCYQRESLTNNRVAIGDVNLGTRFHSPSLQRKMCTLYQGLKFQKRQKQLLK